MATEVARAPLPTLGHRPALDPTRPLVNVAAALVATAVALGIGVLTGAGYLPWVQPGGPVLTLPEELVTEPTLIVIWFGLMMLAGLAAPILAFVLGFRDRRVRLVLLPYLLILASHIGSEAIMREVFFVNMSLFLGLLYSPYRSWQSWRLWRTFGPAAPPVGRTQRLVAALLALEAWLWLLNPLILLLFKLPRVIAIG